MIDDLQFGTRDRRGDWKPHARIQYPPAPWQITRFLRWLLGYPGYFFPYGAAYAVIGTLLWLYATPAMDTMRSFAPGWIAFLLARNAVIVAIVYGAWHFALYVRRVQGTAFKFDGRWPTRDHEHFVFRDQTKDNVLWTLASGVPIWTAFEVVAYWVFANGYVPWVDFAAHPVWCLLLILATPALHDVHFYCVHRLLHWKPLYRRVHSLHHHNVNPCPWSGLAMHPVEHVLYFSGIFLHFVIPSHPFHAMYHGLVSALGPARGHAGFEKLAVGASGTVPVKSHQHYLHHRYFECNYGDGPVPIDQWMGTFHDGSPEADVALRERLKARATRLRMAR